MQTTLYVMLGYPGAGKTTTSKLLSEISGAKHIWADYERKLNYGQPTYSESENNELYDELNKRAINLLTSGQDVIYDTAFNHYADRQKLRKLAARVGAETVVLWVQTPKEIAENRSTTNTHKQPTRVLNDYQQLNHERFEYLSSKLEEPHNDETVIVLDGTRITKSYLTKKIHIHEV